MAVLDHGVADWRSCNDPTLRLHPTRRTAQHPARTAAVPSAVPSAAVPGGVPGAVGHEEASLVDLHQSIAALLASRGEYRQAYEHLRHAWDLATEQCTPHVPEQVRQEVARLRREHAEAREQSLRDSLTTSYNRRYLDQRLRDVGEFAVALVDIDLFKRVNDTFGHLVGDRVLRKVVELLQLGLPEDGFCARYGGEEFVLVLPGLESAAAWVVAEAARARVEQFSWASIVRGLRVTISVGVAHEPGASGLTGAEQQLRLADGLLYTAKQSGRNTVAYRVGGQVRLSGGAGQRSPHG